MDHISGFPYGRPFHKTDRHFMARTFKTIAFAASATDEAQAAAKELIALYGQEDADEADVIVALGGDGFMLQTLHKTMNSGKLIYGMNRGSIGFLMNRYSTENLHKRLAEAVENTFRPLEMQTTDADGNSFKALAINEVYLFRQSYQAAKLRVVVDNRVRLEELVCDGVLLSTPAGSTAYNLSAHGPILPLEAPLLALTPVSPGAGAARCCQTRSPSISTFSNPKNARSTRSPIMSRSNRC
jgi:NAD+ kinase